MSAANAGPVMNVATDNIVRPRQDAFPYPEGDIPVRMEGLDHFGLDFPDLEAAERWYVDVLGAKILVRRGWGGGVNPAKPHTDIQLGSNPGSVISMFIGETSTFRSGSSIHFAFRCNSIEDLEAWKKHLDSKGVRNEIWAHYGCGAISTYFRDPWNYRLEVTVWYADWPEAEKIARARSIPVIGEGGKYPTV